MKIFYLAQSRQRSILWTLLCIFHISLYYTNPIAARENLLLEEESNPTAHQQPDTLKELHEVIVHQDRNISGSTLTSAQPSQRISAQQWEALGITQAWQAMKLLGGIGIRDYGGIGGMKTVSVRNMGAGHSAITLDGIPITNTQAGQVDLSKLPNAAITQIKTDIGHPGALDAPAMTECASGTIHLTSLPSDETTALHPDLKRNHKAFPSITLRGEYASWNTIGTSISTRHQTEGGQQIGAYIDYRHSDGDYPFTLTNGTTQTRQTRVGGAIDQVSALGHWTTPQHHYSDQYWFSSATQISYYYSDRGLPGSIVLYNPTTHEHLWDEMFFAQCRLNGGKTDRWTWHCALKYSHSWSRYQERNIDFSAGHPPRAKRYNYRQDEYYLTASVRYPLTPHWAVALVHDEQIATLRSDVQGCPYPLRHTTGTALRSQYNACQNRLITQINLHYTSIREHQQHRRPLRTTPSENSTSDIIRPLAKDQNEITAGAFITYKPSETLPIRIRAHAKQAFRAPNFNDLYYRQMGNQMLRPEKADEYNLGVTAALGSVHITADVYHHRIKDKIVAFPTTFAWRMSNYGQAIINGCEIFIDYHIKITEKWNWYNRLNYSLQQASSMTPDTGEKSHLPYLPRHSGNATALLSTPWCKIGYACQWCSERYSSSIRSGRYRLNPYCEHSASVSIPIETKPNHKKLNIICSITNLNDQQYEIIQYYPMPGRQLHASISYEF